MAKGNRLPRTTPEQAAELLAKIEQRAKARKLLVRAARQLQLTGRKSDG